MKQDNQVIVGSFERVDFPDLHIKDTVAKIDTGAYTGAVHCSKIRVLKRDGEKVLQFTPSDHQDIQIETKDYTVASVRSSTGHQETRYQISTEIVIQGKRYSTNIGLSNRSSMRYEVLIGRRFLRRNNMLVDVAKGQELDLDMEK